MLQVLLALLACASGRPETAGPHRDWRLAYVHMGDIWTANGDGTGRKLVVKDGRSPCWSRDRKRIAFARDGDVWVIRLADRRLKRLTRNWRGPRDDPGFTGSREVAIAWDPTSNHLYVSHWEDFLVRRPAERKAIAIPVCSIFELSPGGGKPVPRMDLMEDQAAFSSSDNDQPAFSRNGKVFVFVRNGDVWVAERSGDPGSIGLDSHGRHWVCWDMTRLEATADYDAPNWHGSRENYYATHVTVSPDGKLVAYAFTRIHGSGDHSLWLIHRKPAGQKNQTTELAGGTEPCFSPDGKWIAYVCDWHKDVRGIYAQSVDRKSDRLLIPDGEEPAW